MNKIRSISIRTKISDFESREMTQEIMPTTIVEVTLNDAVGGYAYGDTVELEKLLENEGKMQAVADSLAYRIEEMDESIDDLETEIYEKEVEIDKLKETIKKLMDM